VVERGRRVRLATSRHLRTDCLENAGSSKSYNPTGFQGNLKETLYFYSNFENQTMFNSILHFVGSYNTFGIFGGFYDVCPLDYLANLHII
jgi:hypothetical protein